MRRIVLPFVVFTLVVTERVVAQDTVVTDTVITAIRDMALNESRLPSLAHELLDVIGPRLTGSPGHEAAQAWLLERYASWGITARNETYGTWRGWRRGHTHIDLVSPRIRTLEGTLLAWSPGTNGPVTGEAVVIPEVSGPAAFREWLSTVSGKFVLTSLPQLSCRPEAEWEASATPETLTRRQADLAATAQAWSDRLARTGVPRSDLHSVLVDAGAVGLVTSTWSGGWGVNRIFDALVEGAPTLDLSCEDYGLVFRLAENGSSPVLRLDADAELLGEVPVSNTIAAIPGVERSDEYVVLSAHFDSWDGASGATDNGTGTIVMMEAMRILRAVYPEPRRTILVGHWSGEEQGLNGSRAFAEDHPEVVRGLQVLFNQDNGTGRIVSISMMGFTGLAPIVSGWLEQLPTEITQHIALDVPGTPATGGSDHASFVCHGVPALRLGSHEWDYRTYTWHTNRDTFDKVVFDELRSNAALVAMLAYLASEEPELLPRDRITPQFGWPACTPALRSW